MYAHIYMYISIHVCVYKSFYTSVNLLFQIMCKYICSRISYASVHIYLKKTKQKKNETKTNISNI